ncbi:hypothetical protein [Actinomadura flavalba]|uniref:hypothetical protein n=1 Tax=Actinomadura flavalba TaxID=1120938 RepID=UPI000364D0A6|nr:hypothetical protein [Actinomadura flavalba]
MTREADREAFRRWVREHHPDAGGDPAEFAAGLARWRGAELEGARDGARARARAGVVGVRRRSWPIEAGRRFFERRRRARRLR